jgi:hypothetical protein
MGGLGVGRGGERKMGRSAVEDGGMDGVRAGENHTTSRYRSHLWFIRAVEVIKGKFEGE